MFDSFFVSKISKNDWRPQILRPMIQQADLLADANDSSLPDIHEKLRASWSTINDCLNDLVYAYSESRRQIYPNRQMAENFTRALESRLPGETLNFDLVHTYYMHSQNEIDYNVFSKSMMRFKEAMPPSQAADFLLRIEKYANVLRGILKNDIETITSNAEPAGPGKSSAEYRKWIDGLNEIVAEVGETLSSVAKQIAVKREQFNLRKTPPVAER